MKILIKRFKKINNHRNLNSINIYCFRETGYYFPNIQNTHVSEATYYRLFLEKYLPKELDTLVYLDADIVCLKNPIPYLNQELKKLEKSQFLVAARTEVLRKEVDKRYVNNSDTPWVRLSVREEYFNAGIMIINFKKWIQEGYTSKFLIKLKELNSKIIMWDQDVLNAVINGDYSKLSLFFNFKDNDLESRKDKTHITLKILFFIILLEVESLGKQTVHLGDQVSFIIAIIEKFIIVIFTLNILIFLIL